MNSNFDVAAVPWYTAAADYASFRLTADDPEIFFHSFDQWLLAATEHESTAEQYGVPIIRIRMRLDEFESWCAATGHRNNETGRSRYAEQRAARLF